MKYKDGLILKIVSMKQSSGQSILELLIVVGILAIIMPPLMLGLYISRYNQTHKAQHIQAVSSIQQMEQGIKNIRDQSWNNIQKNGIYHLDKSSGNWVLVEEPITVNDLSEQLEIQDVYRDAQNTIVQTGGTIDPSTKKIMIHISWAAPFSSHIDSSFYLTRYKLNYSYKQTLTTEFNQEGNVKENVTVQETEEADQDNEGEIIIQDGEGITEGTYESAVFSVPYEVVVNTFKVNGDIFQDAAIKLQLSITKIDTDTLTCPINDDYTFVGPDGTAESFFIVDPGESIHVPTISEDEYSNPGQCIRYKIYLNKTEENSPVFKDITFYYSL